MNKSAATNILAFTITILGIAVNSELMFSVGLFALSGAFTNWLAVHMLFEKVPLLYGSGVIPNNFEALKNSIRDLMMNQFFTEANIDRFLTSADHKPALPDFAPLIDKFDFNPAFDGLLEVVEASSFGSVLKMVGGTSVLEPLREPFGERLGNEIKTMTKGETFQQLLLDELESPDHLVSIRNKVDEIVSKRLDELSPELVKGMIQKIIHAHLGWLVVWGGLFGGLLGLVFSLLGSTLYG